MKGIRKDLNNWRDIPCSRFKRLNIVKMLILPKQIYNTIPIKISARLILQIQLIQKCRWKKKNPTIANTIFKQKKKGVITLPDVKVLLLATGIKSVISAKEKSHRSMKQIKNEETISTQICLINF